MKEVEIMEEKLEIVPLELKLRLFSKSRCFGDPDVIDGGVCRNCALWRECLSASFRNFLKLNEMLKGGERYG